MRIVVIGGGISGLACAYRLRELGVPALLLEQSHRGGGIIDSVHQDEFLFERGPQSFLSTDLLLELIGKLGLASELLRANPRAPRYVLLGGRLRRVPMGPPEFLATSLLGIRAKCRLLLEPLRRSQPPETDESVADFVRRKFGGEVLENLVGPFVSGVYAGDPEKLSLRSAFPLAYHWEKESGSVIRGAMKSRSARGKPRPALCSFKGGVATLVRTLGEKLEDSLRCGTSVGAVNRITNGKESPYRLQVIHHGQTETLTARAVVVATDTLSASRILAGVSAPLAAQLAKIEYAPVVILATGFGRDQVAHPLEGFGLLVPRREGLRLLGTVWSSSLFPGRAPPSMVNLASFAGGATDPEICQWSEEKIVQTITGELAGVLKITGPPAAGLLVRHDRALPQYNLGHTETIAALRELCAAVPGLFLIGNYLEGPSVGTCVEQAFRTAESVSQYLVSVRAAAPAKALDRSATLGHN